MQLPEVQLKWLRGAEHIDFSRPNTYLAVGMRGSGKSSLLESIASRYPKVIDLFGSKDAECLAWCKPESPFKDVLFIVGRNVNVISRFPQVCVDKLTLDDFEKHRVIITTHNFYNSNTEYFKALQTITGLLWDCRSYWTEPWCVIIREAANMIYSRLQIVKDSNMAKSDFIQMLREARHSGLAVAVDTIRWTSLDKEIRDVSDYIFFKRLGSIGLPKDLSFLYRYFDPMSMMKLRPEVFVTLTSQGNIGFGKFDYPQWHKEEKENIMLKLDINPVRLDKEAEHGFNVGISEHAEIVTAYIQLRSMRKVARKLRRSLSTISEEIKLHNQVVAESGTCFECEKADSPNAKLKVSKRMESMEK
jgi:hypothetical protein